MRRDAEYEMNHTEDSIMEWKKHILRTVHQEQSKLDIIKALRPNEVFLQMDSAMKWLPASSREDQTSFFGKRGIPWHITVAITCFALESANLHPQYEMHTYVHVFDPRQQDSQAVIAILGDILQRLRSTAVSGADTVIDTTYIRSDNAGCYHSSPTIAAIPQISERTGIRITRWDFSDSQAGKGPCDRAAATIKRQVHMYIDEGHQATNALEFINCATAHGRIKYTSFIYARVDSSSPYKQVSIQQISLYNNFEFRSNTILAWKAYNMGTGHQIPPKSWAPGKQSIPLLTVEQQPNEPPNGQSGWKIISINAPERPHQCDTNANSNENQRSTQDDTDEVAAQSDRQVTNGPPTYYCPEEGCTSSFFRYSCLVKHIENGRHHFETIRQDIREYVISSYKLHIEGMQLLQPVPNLKQAFQELGQNVGSSPPSLTRGWALRVKSPGKAFNKKQRDFLIATFDLGITEKRKQDADFVSKEMRKAQFGEDEWLTPQQIKAFWSRLAQERRLEVPQQHGEHSLQIDIEESALNPDPHLDDYSEEILNTIRNSDIFSDD